MLYILILPAVCFVICVFGLAGFWRQQPVYNDQFMMGVVILLVGIFFILLTLRP